MKKTTAVFLSVLTVAHFSLANSLEDRVNQLEQKVKQLEERLNQLEGRSIIQNQNKQKESMLLNENKPAVEYVLLEKKFHKGENKLYDRDDKILFVFNITSNLKKDVDVIYGNLIVYDKNGNELLVQPIKVYKPLDILKTNKIRPGETFRKTLEIIYEDDKPNLRYVKDASLNEIKVDLKFNKVEFSDGSIEFLN
jgi:hypothetical protein